MIKKAETIDEARMIQDLINEVNLSELGKKHLEFSRCDTLLNNPNHFLLSKYDANEVLGALRCKYFYSDEYLFSKFMIRNNEPKIKFAYVDRLVVKRSKRKTYVAYQLAQKIYQLGLRDSVNICLIEVEEKLVGLYNKLGFKLVRTVEYDFGIRSQLFLNLLDRVNLNRSNSPFIRDLDHHLACVDRVMV